MRLEAGDRFGFAQSKRLRASCGADAARVRTGSFALALLSTV